MTSHDFNETEDVLGGYTCPELTMSDRMLLEAVSYWVEGVLQTGVATIGILSNLASCYILTRKKMLNSFNLLLVTLAAYDTWYLFGAILESCRKFFTQLQTDVHVLLFPYFLYPLHQTSITGSIFMTVAIAFERYIAVHFPLDYNQAMNDVNAMRRRVAKYLIPVFVLSVLINVPKFFEAEIEYNKAEEEFGHAGNGTDYYGQYGNITDHLNDTDHLNEYPAADYDYRPYRPSIRLTELRTHPIYSNYNTCSRFFILGLIPFVLLVFFNVKIYRDIEERRRRRLLINYGRSPRSPTERLGVPGTTALTTATTFNNAANNNIQQPGLGQGFALPVEESVVGAEDSLVVALEAAAASKTDKNVDGKIVETSFVQTKKRNPECRHKSLKKAACSVKKARQQQGRKKGKTGNGCQNEEGSGSNTNDESEHSSKFSSLFRWNKLGTSVDEEGSSGTDQRKTGTPDSPAGPRIEVTGEDMKENIRLDTDTVTIALSKSSNSFKDVSMATHNNNIARPESLSPISTSSNSSLAASCIDSNINGAKNLGGTLASSPLGCSAAQPRIFVSGDVTPPAPCLLRNGSPTTLLLQPPALCMSPTSNGGINNSSNNCNVSRRRNEDSLAVIFMAIILIFLICHFPRILLDLHELATIRQSIACREAGLNQFSLWSLLILNFSHFLLVVNSAGNLVVYCLLGSKFRAECLKTARSIANKFRLTKRYL